MVHRFGGRPVGSMVAPPAYLAPATAPALLLDWTHDNPSPVEKRTVRDLLPSAALVAMAGCGDGYTELFVDQLNRDVVAVTRHRAESRRSVILVAHTAFFPDQVPFSGLKLEVEGRLEAVLLQAGMEQVRDQEFAKEDGWINGLEGWEVRVGEGPVVMEEEGGMVRVDLSLLQPGGIVVLAVTP